MNRTRKRIAGVLFWIATSVVTVVAIARVNSPIQTRSDEPHRTPLVRYLTSNPTRVSAIDLSGRLRQYDPVFLMGSSGEYRQVGHVVDRTPDPSVPITEPPSVTIAWYDPRFAAHEVQFVQHHNDGRLEDVAKLMLPEQKRERIRQQLADAMRLYGDEFSLAFKPLVQQSIQQSLPVIESELQRSIARHRGDIDALAKRWNDEVVRQRLIPLARQEIMPIVKEHGGPTAEKIGHEVWERASLWRFGWRAVYDRTPLPEQNLLNEEWQRFVQKDVGPVLERNMDEIVASVQKILVQTAANPVVRGELADVANDIARDPEAQQLVKDILRETLVDNQRLRQVWSEVWQSEEARRAIDMASRRMEPVLRKIGDELFGTQDEGIDPAFALVLRNQIFGKDRRWIIATPNQAPQDASQPRVIPVSSQWMAYPIVYLAEKDAK
ncbi:putative secreted protein [Rhodopirellula maiorica SM1]|uniref:Putative secreted protein n=1 Tax=Rhodopirellula maiorica SM1 TaxID=1265738 RepID=M5R814_9BACT|nr:hypothetical protein [Rhodopirellula maiorica]EMI15623.1 putative secreted protein [Rhodopirellula maiorica SM1]